MHSQIVLELEQNPSGRSSLIQTQSLGWVFDPAQGLGVRPSPQTGCSTQPSDWVFDPVLRLGVRPSPQTWVNRPRPPPRCLFLKQHIPMDESYPKRGRRNESVEIPYRK